MKYLRNPCWWLLLLLVPVDQLYGAGGLCEERDLRGGQVRRSEEVGGGQRRSKVSHSMIIIDRYGGRPCSALGTGEEEANCPSITNYPLFGLSHTTSTCRSYLQRLLQDWWSCILWQKFYRVRYPTLHVCHSLQDESSQQTLRWILQWV